MKQKLFYVMMGLFCIAGQLFSQTPQQLSAKLPRLAGWEKNPKIEVFNRDNLYDRIDGAAPLFLENNFQELTAVEYKRGNDYISIQIYRHATPEDAFGMYASERSQDMQYFDSIGGEAQGDQYGVFFFAGPIYVKMFPNEAREDLLQTMLAIAKYFADKIDPAASYPAIFQKFPKTGKIPHSEAYIAKNYLGHEFLKEVFTTDYKWGKRSWQVFVIDAKTKSAAEAILKSYFNFTGQPAYFSEGNMMVTDQYNGNVPVIWKEQYIVGAYDLAGTGFTTDIFEYLEQLEF